MHSSVHWSVIYNSQDTEATKGLINRSKDEEDRVHIYWNIVKVKVLVTQSCPTLCDPMDYSPQGSSVHGILWEITLEWVAFSFRGSSQPSDETWVPFIASRFFAIQATREACAGKLSSHKRWNKMKYCYLWQHWWIHRILC